MITEKEFAISNDSYTKKDFYQIYPEILDLVTKITARWNPDSSNESDPGIVLLKVLAFIADKTNYNIDKNVLECFMPSATQEQSMRKLCEMMGYEMKYYNSGTTEITFQYQGSELTQANDYFDLPAFTTVVSDEEGEVNYVLTQAVRVVEKGAKYTANAIEGTLCDVTTSNDTTIKLSDLDENNRLYLPEEMIAQNGVWVRNITNPTTAWESSIWHRVNNLSTQETYGDARYCFKFGYDSKKNLPYIEFSDAIGELIGQGLNVQYVRTTGANGNVAAKVLTKVANTTEVTSQMGDTIQLVGDDGTNYLLLANQSACSNGSDKETLNAAYNNFKRTIGTFDTLVTCRDYANKIYQLVYSDTDNRNLVSNIQVSDYRDELVNATTVLTFEGDVGIYFKRCRPQGTAISSTEMDSGDLVLRPLKSIDNSYNWSSYYNSFKPDYVNIPMIEARLEDCKLASHRFTTPYTGITGGNPLFLVKIYADITAKITTTKKVNQIEEKVILNNVKTALFKNFNARQVDFGEAIPYESIYETILNADSRIKNVALDEPELTPCIMLSDGSEWKLGPAAVASGYQYQYYYLLAKNILAGRLPLFKEYDFAGAMNRQPVGSYDLVYGTTSDPINKIVNNLQITAAQSASEITINYTVDANEAIQMIAPNFKTDVTYPQYVNYHFVKANSPSTAVPANSEYLMQNGDHLYIEYTNSNDQEVWIEYTYNAIITNGISKAVSFNIIKPSFELKDSATEKAATPTKSWVKVMKPGDLWYQTIAGLFALSSNQQIERRDYVKTTFTGITKCYWITKDGYLFHTGENTKILEPGEYYFYTDDAENVLVTLGSGTKLVRTDGYVYYIDPDDNELSEEEVAQKGLGAFTSTKWKTYNYANHNFIIQEMQIVTLSEGDTLNKITNLESANINNTWKTLGGASYTLSDGTTGTLPGLPTGNTWSIKSRLDLNIGPSTSQTIKYSSNATKSVALYKLSGSSYSLFATLTTQQNDEITLNCNYTINEAGNEYIIRESSLTEANLPGLKLLVYKLAQPTAGGNPLSEAEYHILHNGEYTTSNPLVLNTAIPDDACGMIMFYWDIGDNATITGGNVPIITAYKSDGTSPTTGFEVLSRWSDDPTCQSYGNTGNIFPGINVFKIKSADGANKVSSIKVKMTTTPSSDTTLTFDNMSYIPSANNGVDIDRLGITAAEVNTFLGMILGCSYVERPVFPLPTSCFYANHKPNNSLLIDETTMKDPTAWYDYNNICNKFVITELDTGKYNDNSAVISASGLTESSTAFPHITLTKASKA